MQSEEHLLNTRVWGTKVCIVLVVVCREVLAYDVYENPSLDFVEYVSLDELLAKSDLVSLHCPLTEETYHLINRETIQKMKDGTIV